MYLVNSKKSVETSGKAVKFCAALGLCGNLSDMFNRSYYRSDLFTVLTFFFITSGGATLIFEVELLKIEGKSEL